jgi:hypothetical protein
MKTTELTPRRRLSADERALLRKLISDARRAQTEHDFRKRAGARVASS